MADVLGDLGSIDGETIERELLRRRPEESATEVSGRGPLYGTAEARDDSCVDASEVHPAGAEEVIVVIGVERSQPRSRALEEDDPVERLQLGDEVDEAVTHLDPKGALLNRRQIERRIEPLPTGHEIDDAAGQGFIGELRGALGFESFGDLGRERAGSVQDLEARTSPTEGLGRRPPPPEDRRHCLEQLVI